MMRSTLISLLFAALLAMPALGQRQVPSRFFAVPARSTSTVRLLPTPRLPDARGKVQIRLAHGTAHIEARLDGMRPATLFGGDFNTYVLWIVRPDGHAQNSGECVLNGDRCRIEASTGLDSFGMFVTAEPHFAVKTPSRFIVLTVASRSSLHAIDDRSIHPVYNYERDTLAGTLGASNPVFTDVAQALTAVRLAERAGAGRFAKNELDDARRSLRLTYSLWQERKPHHAISDQAQETVRLAAEAQTIAENRAPGFR